MQGVRISRAESNIRQQIIETLATGEKVDIFRMAAMFHARCPELSLEDIVQALAEALAEGIGAGRVIKNPGTLH